MDSIFGMLIFALGGLCGAAYQLPSRWVKNWAFESWWFIYVVSALVIAPPVICYFTVPDFMGVIASVPLSVSLRCSAFGMMWGVGAVCWGLMIRYLGFGLGLAIGCGIAAAGGTLIPPIAQGHAADLVKDTGALIVLAGVIFSLVGIVLVGVAGKLKENELPEEEKKKAVPDFNFKKGVLVAVMAGIFSAGQNFGLQGGGLIEEAAVKAGAAPTWRGMPVIMLVMWGGFIIQTTWCISQNIKNHSFGDYIKIPRFNYLLSFIMGLIWISQIVCVKAGEPLMGSLKYISFGVMMASSILFSTIIGVALGEWKGTGKKTKACLILGTIVLIVSFTVMSLGSK